MHTLPYSPSALTKRDLMGRIFLNHYLIFAFPGLLFVSLILVNLPPIANGWLLIPSVVSLTLFTLLFSISWQEKAKINIIWLIVGIVISIAAFAAILFNIISIAISYSNTSWYEREQANAISWILLIVFGIGSATSWFSVLWYSILYFFEKDRLPYSTMSVGLTMTFLILLPVSFAFLFLIQDDWEIRQTLDLDILGTVVVITVLFCLAGVLINGMFLKSFLYPSEQKSAVKTSWLTLGVLVLMMAFMAALLLPSLGSVKEKSNRSKQRALERYAEQEFSRKNAQSSGGKSVRIREYFPETLYWNPDLLAKNGKAQINIPVSDSITTFRMTCQAVTSDGALGSMTKAIRVFQDFFVDVDFPASLTQNDQISVPVQIYNYLPENQSVRLKVQKEDWFELLESEEKTVEIASNEVSVVYFRIQARRPGIREFTVFAYGTKMDDAIRRSIRVMPDGKMVENVLNNTLSKTVEHTISIDPNSIPEASDIVVKCYPGIQSVLIEGMEGMLHLPHG